MAGHSKWANIKYRKEKADRLKGKKFTKITKELITATKLGGSSDPKSNVRLRLAIQKAKAVNMPNETIERNIKKATTDDQGHYVETIYEIYGKGGLGIVLEVVTDNRNRTASDIRTVLNKKGGVLTSPGAVLYNFEKRGVIHVCKKKVSESLLFLTATDGGAEEFESTEAFFIIITPPEALFQVKEAIDALQIPSETVELQQIPKEYVVCSKEDEKENLALIDALEELEDVVALYHNLAVGC